MVAATLGNHKKYSPRRIYKSNLMNAFSAGSGKVIVEVNPAKKVTDETGAAGHKTSATTLPILNFLNAR